MLEEIRKTIGWVFVVGLIAFLVFFLALQSAVVFQFLPSSGAITGYRGEKLAVLSLEGPIFEVQDQLDRLRDFQKDKGVKGLLIEVDSPGGAVGPSQELASAVSRFEETGRPVVASVRSVGASGAYYVASSADTIVANPGSIVGSIGVLVQFMEFKDLMGKIGVDYQVVKSGDYKDLGSPFREMEPDEREILRELIMSSYDQFIRHILDHRPQLGRAELERIADGRILTGEQATEKRLIDRQGSRREALDILRNAAGVSDNVTLWKPSAQRFISGVSKQLLNSFSDFIPRRKSGLRLLYMMPDWGAQAD